MPAIAGRTRRKRNAEPLVSLATRVPEHTRVAANTAAEALGISVNQYVQLLVDRDEQQRQEGSGTAA